MACYPSAAGFTMLAASTRSGEDDGDQDPRKRERVAVKDWNYHEDRSRSRTGFGPENNTRLRRFAVGILKSFQQPAQSIAEMMRALSFCTGRVFDYLRMTKNSLTGARGL